MTKQLPPYLRKAFLTVSRQPSTVHESSSILAHLNKYHGPVVYFSPLSPADDATVKASAHSKRAQSGSRTIYQILFDVKHASTLQKAVVNHHFQVALPASNPDVEDPFNVRGLHGRMPVQAENVIFQCELRDTPPAGLVAPFAMDEWPTATVSSRSPYKAAKQGTIVDTLRDTGAPRGLFRNLVPLSESDDARRGAVGD